MQQGRPLVKKGQFYFIFEGNESDLILEDKTKRGLEVQERTLMTSMVSNQKRE